MWVFVGFIVGGSCDLFYEKDGYEEDSGGTLYSSYSLQQCKDQCLNSDTVSLSVSDNFCTNYCLAKGTGEPGNRAR